MAERTSSQIAKDKEQQAVADDLFASGFGDAGNVTTPEPETISKEPTPVEAMVEPAGEGAVLEPDDDAMAAMLNAVSTNANPMPPSVGEDEQPAAPPSGPPPSDGGPPSSGPPGGGPPSGPPEQSPSSNSGPPGGPPSGGPPGGSPPSGPPPSDGGPPGGGPPGGSPPSDLPSTFDEPTDMSPDNSVEPVKVIKEPLPIPSDAEELVSQALDMVTLSANKIENLETEIERLRGALTGSAEIISEIENQPMPPVVGPDYVISAHMVADFVRIGRQLHREGLVHSDVGAVSILNPDEAGLMHTSVEGAIIGQMTEDDIASGRFGQPPPPNAPEQWRILEVLLASKTMETRGPAACIYTHPPYATAISCEQDLIVLKPIDEEGIKHLGNIVIVEPDDEDQEGYLRQLAEALKQGNMKAVVVKGHGVFSTGTTFDEAWRWASVIEHSMRILMHARQANLKV